MPIPTTVFSYDIDGVDCGSGFGGTASKPDVDPDGDGPFSLACIGLKLCVGTPVRRCAVDVGVGDLCQEDANCDPGVDCQLVDLLPPGPPAVPPDAFPDLVGGLCNADGSACDEDADCTVPADICNLGSTDEYGCICEENVVYRGPICDEASGDQAGASCADDTDCVDGTHPDATCLDAQIQAEQCIFFTGDAKLKRGGRSF